MKATIHLLGALIILGLCVDEAASQRRRRGSVRYARPDGTVSRTTGGGGRVSSTQTTQGNRRTTQNTATTRGGESVTGTREVVREDEQVTVNRQAQTSTGANRESSREVEFDDCRVESVERESQATGRYGEYYHDQRDEIDPSIASDEAFVNELRRQIPSKLAEKLRGSTD